MLSKEKYNCLDPRHTRDDKNFLILLIKSKFLIEFAGEKNVNTEWGFGNFAGFKKNKQTKVASGKEFCPEPLPLSGSKIFIIWRGNNRFVIFQAIFLKCFV